MAVTSDLQKGQTIRYEDKLWFVTKVEFVNPGKGTAFYRIKLKNVENGKVVDYTLKSGTSVEIIQTERRNVEFLYKEGEKFVVMEDDTYEQFELMPQVVGEDIARFLKDGEKLIVFFADGEPVNVSFKKQKIAFEVTAAEPAVKGDTATSSNRPVGIETGATVEVPLFINKGDSIIVNVETGEYCEREK